MFQRILSSFGVAALVLSATVNAKDAPRRRPSRAPAVETTTENVVAEFFNEHPARVGVQVGPAIYGIDTAGSPDMGAGVAVGLTTDIKINRYFYAQPEVMYIQKGASTDSGLTDVTLTRHYLEIPLLVKAMTQEEHFGVRPFGFFGPNLGFHLGSDVNVKTTVSLNDHTDLMDFSLDMGFGAEKTVANKVAAFAAFRGSVGLIDTSDVQGDQTNYGIQILFGARYSI
jgi:hypothetical protein